MKKFKVKRIKWFIFVFALANSFLAISLSSCSLTSNLNSTNNNSNEGSNENKNPVISSSSDQNIENNIQKINDLKNWNSYPANIKNYQAILKNTLYSKNANFIDENTGLIYDLTSKANIDSLIDQYKKANPNASQEDIDKQIDIYQATTNLLYLQVAPQVITYWYAVFHIIDVNNFNRWNLDEWWVQNINLWISNSFLNDKYQSYLQNYYNNQIPIPISIKTQMANDFETIYGKYSIVGYDEIQTLYKFTNLNLDSSLNNQQKLANQNYQNYNYYNLLSKINDLVNSKIFDNPNYTKFLNDNDKENLLAIKKYVASMVNDTNAFQQAYKKYFNN